MDSSYKWIVYGGLYLLLSLFVYSISLSDQTLSITYSFFLLILGSSTWLIMTGIFLKMKYYNYMIYLILTAIILVVVTTLILNQASSPEYHGSNRYSYIIVMVFILTTIYETYGIIKEMDLHQHVIKSFEKDLITDPMDIKALNNKGAALSERNFNQEALKCFDKILEIDSKDAVAWHNRGVMLDKLSKHQEAIKCYDKALKLDPRFENAKNAGKTILES
jgi:tetratricopeptide (TPR) repeat protein